MDSSPSHANSLVQISTDIVPGKDKVPFWADMVCQHLIQVECNPLAAASEFYGAIRLRQLGQVDISQVESVAQEVKRTARLMARADQEYFLVNIQRQGCSTVQQDGRVAKLEVGDMAIYSSARGYQLNFGNAFSQTVLIFPAAVMRVIHPRIDEATAMTLQAQQPTVRMLTFMADHLFPMAGVSPAMAQHTANALTETLATSVVELAGHRAPAQSNLALFHLARIKQHVLEHLADADLSVTYTAQALAISPAHIHRLFENEGQTFSAWMWSQRLHACQLALVNPNQTHCSVSQIAFSHGFNSASHFARMFRSKYGTTPREWRDRHIMR